MSVVKVGTWAGYPLYAGDKPDWICSVIAVAHLPCAQLSGAGSIQAMNELVADTITEDAPEWAFLVSHKQLAEIRLEMFMTGLAQFEATP